MIRTDAFSGHCWSEKGVGLFAKPRQHVRERLDIVEGSMEVDDAGAQQEPAVHDRVRQERFSALLERCEQLADSTRSDTSRPRRSRAVAADPAGT